MATSEYPMYVDGEFVAGETGELIDSVDPWSGEVWARIPRGGPGDVDRAVAAARRAFESGEWAAATATDRGKYLFALADELEDRAEANADRDVRDNGKPIKEMGGQHRAIPDWIRYYAGLADKVQGDTIPSSKGDKFVYTKREPVGVVAGIPAFNSPLLMAVWKLAPALAAGCTIVLKPDELAATSTLTLGEAADAAGIPDGVLNVVTGYGDEVGGRMVDHDDVDLVSFTGGTDTGAHVAQTAGGNLTRTVMELGGKNPNVVFPDARLDDAVTGALSGVFSAAGQSCSAGSRLVLHESIHDEFVEKLVAGAESIRIGDPGDPETEMGPLASRERFEAVAEYVDRGKREATMVTGGIPDPDEYESDCVVEPTIFTDVAPDATIAQEEIFGPVLAVVPFADEREAVEIANGVDFGLAAGVWTEDMRRAHRMVDALDVGRVWVNNYRNSDFTSPQGGVKDSGWGRENGREAIEEYLDTKAVWVDLSEDDEAAFELV